MRVCVCTRTQWTAHAHLFCLLVGRGWICQVDRKDSCYTHACTHKHTHPPHRVTPRGLGTPVFSCAQWAIEAVKLKSRWELSGDGGWRRRGIAQVNAHKITSSDVALMTFATCQSCQKVCREVSGEVFTPKRKQFILRRISQAGVPINKKQKKTPGWVGGGEGVISQLKKKTWRSSHEWRAWSPTGNRCPH